MHCYLFIIIVIYHFLPCECLFRQKQRGKVIHERNYAYKTQFFTQKVDHFGFYNEDTYQQRYLVADQFWNGRGGPIFFYTGNEGDIEWFCDNTGFMWDIAPDFKAMLVFAEHRYYGKSVPYGPDVFKDPAKLNFFTSEQALEDYALLLKHIKSTTSAAANSPVIAFGGSYGGMLAAWFRMKYPDIVIGSLAASAPIWEFPGLIPCASYSTIVTRSFNLSSPQCVGNIKKSWSTIDSIGCTESGREFMTETLKLCSPLKSLTDVTNLKSWLSSIWGDLAMVNYPYPASFLQPLPGWPVKAVCEPLSTQPLKDRKLIQQLYQAVNIYFNYTGNVKCLNTSQTATQSLDDLGWDYQACTEMVMPFCSNGQTDMFEPSTWNFKQFSDNCFKQWKVHPREYWIEKYYGGKTITYASNIIFSNGYLDPWSGGGVLNSLSNTLIAINIPDGAHHLDLRSANPKDTEYVKSARQQEKNIIRYWLDTYYKHQ